MSIMALLNVDLEKWREAKDRFYGMVPGLGQYVYILDDPEEICQCTALDLFLDEFTVHSYRRDRTLKATEKWRPA